MYIFLRFFYRDDNISYGELFFSCALITHNAISSLFNSWVADVIGVKFLAQGNNSSRKPQLGINYFQYKYTKIVMHKKDFKCLFIF